MANELVNNKVALPAAFAGAKPAPIFEGKKYESAADGIDGSFGLLKYKGKTWSLQYRGGNHPFLRADGDGARNSIEVVVLKSATAKSKSYYPGTYAEGERKKPTCWSNDGIRPDRGVGQPVSQACASCPMNEFGSKITEQGKKAKACSDFKRIAVVLDPKMSQEVLGYALAEPVMLRIPASSLNDYASYGEGMNAQNFPMISIVSRVAFDPSVPYPKFKFEPVRALTQEEGIVATEMRDLPIVGRILGEGFVIEDDAPRALPPGNPALAALTGTATDHNKPVAPATNVTSGPGNGKDVVATELSPELNEKVKALLG